MQIEAGTVLDAKITGITSFGAFAELKGGKSGLIHISEISEEYVEDVSAHLKKGQKVKVKVISVQGDKISLSIKRALHDEKRSRRENKSRPETKAAPKSAGPPEVFEFAGKHDRGDLSFDDMLQKFKRDSDEKFQDLKRSNDSKRSGGYKRTY